MIKTAYTGNWVNFFLRIILPSIMAIAFFIVALYVFIIPTFEGAIMDRKREMISELTNSALSIITKYQLDEADGLLTRDEAQEAASSKLRYLRYGDENKDYFWITDMYPNMIMHPYRSDLEGQPLTDFRDPHGKRMFVDFKEIVLEEGEGFSDYMWQWKDDSSRIVPKLSFIKEFKPWGWIIGTGIYTEDVKAEIAKLEKHIIRISLLITLVIFLLLAFIMRQSMRIEGKRQRAETSLKDSRERYKALVEASTEGSFMLFEDYIYANRTILELLGYDEDEISRMKISEVITGNSLFRTEHNHAEILREFTGAVRDEGSLRRKDGSKLDVILDISKTAIAGKEALIIITRELTFSNPGLLQPEETRRQFSHITESLQIGFFRSTLARRSYFIEANEAAISIMGFNSKNEMLGANIEDLFADVDERKRIVKELITFGYVKKRVIRIVRKDMSKAYIMASLTVVSEPGSNQRYCDGLVEDITEQAVSGFALDALISEIRYSQTLVNRPVKSFVSEPVSIHKKTAIRKAAQILDNKTCGAMLVHDDQGEYLGIVTNEDFRKRVVAHGAEGDSPVYEIMTSPLVSIREDALLWEALLLMKQKNVAYLAAREPGGKIVHMLSKEKIAEQYLDTGEAALVREIQNTQHYDTLPFIQKKLQMLVAALSENGIGLTALTRIVSSISEAIIVRVNEFAQEEFGPPPVPYAFISLGSVGREEQTLATDQDNAIIYQDSGDESGRDLQTYFLNLGEFICNKLNIIGYAFCKGAIMARNPKFCKPLSVWKSYFTQWVTANEPKDLLDVNIFFDFRISYGDSSLSDALREHLQKITEHNNAFFYHLAVNTLSIKPSLSIFGNIIRDGKEANPDTFDIKRAIMPLTGFARIYALRHSIPESNTMNRIEKIFEQGIILRSEYEKIVQMYEYLMLMRFRHQVKQIRKIKSPDNYVNPEMLTDLDQAIIKKIFSQIGTLQTKLSFDFKGSSG